MHLSARQPELELIINAYYRTQIAVSREPQFEYVSQENVVL